MKCSRKTILSRAIQLGLAAAAVAALAAYAPASVIFEAGFETAEGYSPGQLDGQVGWFADADPGDCVVQNAEVAVGEQAAMMTADRDFSHPDKTFGEYSFWLGGRHELLAELSENPIVTIRLQVMVSATDLARYGIFAAWENLDGDPSNADMTDDSLATAVLFEPDGDISVSLVETDWDWTPGVWEPLVMELDFDTETVNVWYAENLIATGGWPFFDSPPGLDVIEFATNDGPPDGAGSSFFWDELTVEVTPEPATLALMGLGIVGLALCRRRYRKP
jgi:hypothetical protein